MVSETTEIEFGGVGIWSKDLGIKFGEVEIESNGLGIASSPVIITF